MSPVEHDPDRELERLRAERLSAMQVEAQAAIEKQTSENDAEVAKADKLRSLLTVEARQRLRAVEMARPDEGTRIRDQIVELADQSRIQVPIDDASLKRILAGVDSARTRPSVRRI